MSVPVVEATISKKTTMAKRKQSIIISLLIASPTLITMSSKELNKKKNPLQHLIAGGCAGLVESSVCHPLDTIKTRMQLRKNQVESVEKKIQHSLVEPALRLKHSLQEPGLRMAANAEGGSATLRGLPPQQTTGSAKITTLHTTKMPGTTVATLGPIGTAKRIIKREGFFSLYKGELNCFGH